MVMRHLREDRRKERGVGGGERCVRAQRGEGRRAAASWRKTAVRIFPTQDEDVSLFFKGNSGKLMKQE